MPLDIPPDWVESIQVQVRQGFRFYINGQQYEPKVKEVHAEPGIFEVRLFLIQENTNKPKTREVWTPQGEVTFPDYWQGI